MTETLLYLIVGLVVVAVILLVALLIRKHSRPTWYFWIIPSNRPRLARLTLGS